MKASELIADLKRLGPVSSLSAFEAATMLEHYLALADELDQEAEHPRASIPARVAYRYAAERLRELAEGREET